VVKKGVFLHNGIVERSQFLLDEKLFISHLGYDSCLPLNIVDVETGLKLDAGPCGGILQVGAHELYYCSGEGSFIINTGTLERRSLQRLPCPGKTGELYPHPLPGHFIFISAPLC
jgi:hypothetical protein